MDRTANANYSDLVLLRSKMRKMHDELDMLREVIERIPAQMNEMKLEILETINKSGQTPEWHKDKGNKVAGNDNKAPSKMEEEIHAVDDGKLSLPSLTTNPLFYIFNIADFNLSSSMSIDDFKFTLYVFDDNLDIGQTLAQIGQMTLSRCYMRSMQLNGHAQGEVRGGRMGMLI
ncbi:hypothetical protein PanWU01x14_187400 [Parasponia andersonii]|uniref:Uncharacterized protein n=1 Tax=Parasponia andersonii TaxID=3476 RepID=A0A2P5C3B0_PARAD|nr:hypothetical protein PanWU01x14_187400 [Parasponia andersonii]